MRRLLKFLHSLAAAVMTGGMAALAAVMIAAPPATTIAAHAPLVAAIEARGWTVWWDPAMSPGQEFDRQISAELKLAAAVLVVWTPD